LNNGELIDYVVGVLYVCVI